MFSSNIVLFAIIGICGFMLIWSIKNANNIKFKKKEKKSKMKKSAEDKYKDVIPKEKKEKKEKPKKDIIKDSVKEDLKQEAEANSKVTKITKEDFTKNDMTVPTALLSETEKTEKAKEIAKQSNKPGGAPRGFDFNFDNDLKPFKSPLGGDVPFNFEDEFKDLLPPSKSDIKKDPALDFPDLNFLDDDLDFDPFDTNFNSEMDKPVDNGLVSDKFEKVFGKNKNPNEIKNEIIIGDILSAPRYRNNRRNRKYF